MPDKKLTDVTDNNVGKISDNEIIKALERLKNTKDYLKEQYQEQVKKCPYPELKPIAKQTYEDNKKAFDIAIKAIEEFNRLQAEKQKLEIELQAMRGAANSYKAENKRLKKGWKADVILTANAKAEAYKEFAERLKESYDDYSDHSSLTVKMFCYDIDNLLKELVGEK